MRNPFRRVPKRQPLFFTCPRRVTDGRATKDTPFPFDGPNIDHWRQDGTCSYDGSVSAEEFMAYVRAGKTLGATDKPYKIYLNELPTSGVGKFYTHHLVPEDLAREFVQLRAAGLVKFDYEQKVLYVPGFKPEWLDHDPEAPEQQRTLEP